MSYSYGSLTVRVTGDTKPLRDDVKTGATSAGQEAAKGIGDSMNRGLSAFGGLGLAVGKSVATGLGVASTAAIGFGVSAFKTAARVQEMDTTLVALANTNNLNVDSLRKVVGGVRATGIETAVAQGLVAQFVRSNLDLAKATDLARVAQDAAVISGRNSTEVLEDLVHGITTQNTQVLRNAGIQVNATKAQDEFAKSIGKTRAQLTEAEKAQATLNAVIKEGEKVAGAYELALKEPGKVLRSFKRVFDDIKLSIGEGLLQAFGPLILQAYDLAKAFSAAVEFGGPLWPIFDAMAVAVMRLVDPITGLTKRFTEFLKVMSADQLKPVVAILERFGPAIVAVGVGLSAITGGAALTKLPVIGSLFTSILGPVKALGPALAALPPPVLAVVAVVAALLAVSPKLRDSVVAVAKALISALRPAFDAVVAGVKLALPAILDLARTIGDKLAPIIDKLIPVLQPLGQLLATVVTIAFQQLADTARALAPIMSVVLDVLGFLVGVIVPVSTWMINLANAALKAADAAGLMVPPLMVLVKVCSAVANAVSTVVRWIFGGSPGLIPAFQAAGAAAGALAGPLRAIIGVFAAVAGAVKSLVSIVTSGFTNIRSVVSSIMAAVSSTVTSAFSGIASAARSGSSAVLAAVTGAFGQVRGVVQSAIGPVAGIVSSGLQAAVGAARSGGAAIMSGLKGGIESAAGAVMSTISSVAGKVAGALSSALKLGSPSKLTIPMGRDLALGLGVGWDRQIDHTLADMTGELRAPHAASPLAGPAAALAGLGGGGGGPVINVYPQAGQDERQIAAMVSRELAWATAGGVR